MPKTIAITPSWYWPPGVARVVGIPPFSITELCVERPARDNPSALALVAGNTRLTAAELKSEVWRCAGALAGGVSATDRIAVPAASASVNSVVLLLGALAAGLPVDLGGGGSPVSGSDAGSAGEGFMPSRPSLCALREPAVFIAGREGPVAHSHRSLLAAVIGLGAFLEVRPGRPWMPLVPLSRWEGLLGLLAPLYFGSAVVLPPENGDAETTVQTIVREGVGYAFSTLETGARLTRDAKKSTKDARRILDAFLLSVDGMFDPDERRRVARSFECPALTVWGTAETGPVFASHPSWYLDESVGIPITNAQVIPSDPRSGVPIQTLWELVDTAEVTVWSPSVCCREVSSAGASWTDNRLRTGMMASSDANGMVYLLGGR
jgi:acyl-coenzyme A synthetase/AMP-(fatty) acid ligase